MNYESIYREKLCTIESLVEGIQSGETFATSVIPMTPQSFFSNLHLIREDVKGVEVFTILNPSPYDFFSKKEFEGRILNNCWFYGPGDRAAADKGLHTVTYVPNNAHQAIADLVSSRRIDYFVGSASAMDEHGFLTLSCSAFIEKDLIKAARRVVLEVNSDAPRTFGDSPIHISEIDHIIEVDHKLPEETLISPTKTEERIGEFIADLIEDGSTIQMGIGGVPYAVSKLLYDKKDLGVHTEMLTEAMMELFDAGVITNSKKTLYQGRFVCAFVFGTQKLYDFVNNNPSVFVMSGSFTNDPYVLGKNYRMTSINAALMVDLTGQVCSEAIGTRHYSGTGGQLDTHRGAVQSALKGLDGKGIIALRSTAKNGEVSKIVPFLPLGSPVTVPRQDIDYIVTEFGVAHLRGKTAYERAKAMISIAHPDHRSTLESEARKIGLLF